MFKSMKRFSITVYKHEDKHHCVMQFRKSTLKSLPITPNLIQKRDGESETAFDYSCHSKLLFVISNFVKLSY